MKKKLNVPLNGLKLIPTSDIIKSMERVAKKIEQELDEEKREVKNMFADENKVKHAPAQLFDFLLTLQHILFFGVSQ